MDTIIDFIVESPVYFIANIITFCIWCIFFDRTLTHKRKKSNDILVHTVCAVIYFIPCFLPLKNPFGFIMYIAMLLAQACFLYSGPFKRKLLTVLFVLITMLIAEAVNMYLYFEPEFLNGGMRVLPAALQIKLYSVYLFINISLLSITASFLNKSKGAFGSTPNIFVTIAFFLEMSMLYFWIRSVSLSDSVDTAVVLLVISICLLGNSAMFYAVKALQDRYRLEAENKWLESSLSAQDGYYRALAEQYESIRKMRHDISNHMFTVNILLEDGKIDKATAYIKELESGQANSYYLDNCHNHVLDAFLHYRIDGLTEKGIKTDVQINLPQSIEISNCDLISVFGNLIDNAEEACLNIENACINIEAELRKNYLYISIENPVQEIAQKKNPRIPELERGLGQRILQSFAEKYDGTFSCSQNSGIYTATILLKAFDGDTVE